MMIMIHITIVELLVDDDATGDDATGASGG